MKFVLLVVLYVSSLNCNAQSQKNLHPYFSKENVNCDFHTSGANKYFKLVTIKQNNAMLKCSYLYDFSKYSEPEKIKMIEDLLSYEGDTSLCAVKPKCYNPKRSQTVPLKIKAYSIQVEALFIINHIILSDPYSFSAFPILRNRGATNLETINGPLVKRAFALYRDWLAHAKKTGLHKTIASGLLPLGNNADVFWL